MSFVVVPPFLSVYTAVFHPIFGIYASELDEPLFLLMDMVNVIPSIEPIYFTYFRFQTRDADTLELAEPERAEITMVSPSLNGRVMVSVVVATS